MDLVVYINDEFVNETDATTSVFDRGYNFGDGVYEVVCAYDYKPFGLEEHLNRYFRGLKEMKITPRYSRASLKRIIKEGLKRAKKFDVKRPLMIYWQTTRGTAMRSHSFPEDVQSNLMMYIKETPNYDKYREYAKATIYDDIRWSRCDIKSLNLIPNCMAAQQAKEKDCVEAIFVKDGIVKECSASSLFYVKDGIIYTHPLSNSILHGVTRIFIKEIIEELGLELVEKESTVEELLDADEVFITSTIKLVLSIDQIDETIIKGERKIAPILYSEMKKKIGL